MSEIREDNQVDLLVVGAGMAGLSAAAYATRAGASVVLVEKADTVGGSAQYAGYIWTAPTVDVMREVNPQGDPELGRRVVEGYDDGIEFVRSLGVTVGDAVPVLGFGRGRPTDMANYLLMCERAVRDAEHGELLLSAEVQALVIDDGRVRGADIVTADGGTRRVIARSTLLATGGFGGDPELRERLIHPQARDMTLRSNRTSTGDGLRLGQAAGAAFGKPDAGFYGHLIPSHIPYDDPYEFVNRSFYHSEHSVLINLEGERFVDESIGDHISTIALLEQPEARALMVYDQRVHDDVEMGPYVQGLEVTLDKFQTAYRLGARCAIAEDVDELEALPEEWGYPGTAARDAVKAFNESHPEDALVNSPLYIIEVIPAITHPFGGLLIDDSARVLDEFGAPIPGLLAAGADAGGLYRRAYAGGLAAALVFGLQAARTALAQPVAGSVTS
jgi:succinate dehydrogenase/fumarate reductase flavoprotein subunit